MDVAQLHRAKSSLAALIRGRFEMRTIARALCMQRRR
jgi:hypothetical protein